SLDFSALRSNSGFQRPVRFGSTPTGILFLLGLVDRHAHQPRDRVVEIDLPDEPGRGERVTGDGLELIGPAPARGAVFEHSHDQMVMLVASLDAPGVHGVLLTNAVT